MRDQRTYLTKNQLAEICGITPPLVRQLTRDGTIAPRFVVRGAAPNVRRVMFRPEAVASVLLLEELQNIFGVQSPTPKRTVAQLTDRIEARWLSPDEPVELQIRSGSVTVSADLGFLRRAQQLIAQWRVGVTTDVTVGSRFAGAPR